MPTKKGPSLKDIAKDAGSQVLAIAPACLAGKSATEIDSIRWVSRNIDNPMVNARDCPDPWAWTLLRQCRLDDKFLFFFTEKLWSKLIPSRATLEEDAAEIKQDGLATVDICEEILAFASVKEHRSGQ